MGSSTAAAWRATQPVGTARWNISTPGTRTPALCGSRGLGGCSRLGALPSSKCVPQHAPPALPARPHAHASRVKCEFDPDSGDDFEFNCGVANGQASCCRWHI